jgi:hypothetical protein
VNDPDAHLAITCAARAAHEANRSWCLYLGDMSQETWGDAPQWQRDSAIAGARAIHDNPATTPEQSHEGWLAMKRADGWSYGTTKDASRKLHPCFLPYAQLPLEQRAKDRIFGEVVRAILYAAGHLKPVAEGVAP